MQRTSSFRQLQLILLAGLMALPLSFAPGCVPIVVTDEVAYAPDPPPNRRVDTRTVRPGPRHVWRTGRWIWRARASRYVWVPGKWTRLRHPHHRHWVPGRWIHSSRGYRWRAGHWR